MYTGWTGCWVALCCNLIQDDRTRVETEPLRTRDDMHVIGRTYQHPDATPGRGAAKDKCSDAGYQGRTATRMWSERLFASDFRVAKLFRP